MSDMGDDFRQDREDFKERRDLRVAAAAGQLARSGLRHRSADGGYHYILETPAGVLDFWPSRGKWLARKSGARGSGGVDGVLRYLSSLRPSGSSSGAPAAP